MTCRDLIAEPADYRTCEALAEQLPADPELLKRCIYYSDKQKVATPTPAAKPPARARRLRRVRSRFHPERSRPLAGQPGTGR